MRNKNGYDTLYGLIKELGGWPMIDGPNWNETAFDWINAYQTLTKLNIDYFLRIDLMLDIKNTSLITIKVFIYLFC